ncbi:TIGR01777 family oxidoreductase [Aquibacillus koreensis]|uniref:TIGR01777 family oxidoreductase n=1 Tax=Aquibacillus koreensis TaxID=279446 RepID=A0A9X3WMX0_9BACI|nr:TIGR01777 family oxidoreductase [Aquibacillus koreensis]MCT2534386.1 TIGR01777 family oxidoreductase [Aquibacillus koreensis]MDC3421693.1 TIGR01777 family oxidoreductase [Aquibacillus koreensis]
MHIAVTGGTGFIGSKVTESLIKQGHHIYVLTRSPDKHENTEQITYVGWLKETYKPETELPNLDAIINLAGDSLFGYWTETKKQRIIDSRIQATENAVALIEKLDQKPSVFINASAIGFYGTSDTETFTENTTTPGNDFLAEVTSQWEQTAKKANELGVRTVFTRFGIVLGKEGALPMMALPFKMFAGGKVGTGEQWMSWVHVDDVVEMIKFSLHHSNVEGALNVTAPNPVRNKAFSKTLARVLGRPYWLPAPAFAMKTILGEMSLLVLEGQCVKPNKATESGYTFLYPELTEALREIYLQKTH